MDQLLQDPEDEFVQVVKYSGPSLVNIADNMELYLFKMPPHMINPSDLINKEMVISKKQNCVSIKGKKVEVEARKGNFLKSLTLMIPSGDGNLVPVEKNISCQVALKTVEEDVSITNGDELDFNLSESVVLRPPELTRRDFYGRADTQTRRKSNKSSKKKRKESNICTEESFKVEENQSFNSVKKQKKKRKRDESGDESPIKVKVEYLPESTKKRRNDSSLQLDEQFNSLDSSISKKKKRKLGIQ